MFGVKTRLAGWARRARRSFPDHRLHHGQVLPSLQLRDEMCGDIFLSDDYYLHSGVIEAQRLASRLGYREGSCVLDVGCGLGRLATGMQCVYGDANYLGIDPCERFLSWCRKYIQRPRPRYCFEKVDTFNERFNPSGTERGRVRFPAADASADIVYLWGVFTNVDRPEAEGLASEIGRVLRPNGRAFITAFVEDGVPEVSPNPEGYCHPFSYTGPLNVVRFDRRYLFGLFAASGVCVEEFRHHLGPFAYQSELYLRRT